MQKTETLRKILEMKSILTEVSNIFFHPKNNKFSYACLKVIGKMTTMENSITKKLQKLVDEPMRIYLKEREKINKSYFVMKDGKPLLNKNKDGELTKKIDKTKQEYEIKKLDKKYPDNKKKWEKLHIEETKLLNKKMNINVHMIEEKDVPPMPRSKIELFYDFMVIADKEK